jgi:hypothetical protein
LEAGKSRTAVYGTDYGTTDYRTTGSVAVRRGWWQAGRVRKWLLVTGIFGVVLVVIALLTRDSEPRYNGHSLSYWLDKYGQSNPSVYSSGREEDPDPQAVEAISRIGTNGLPLLLNRLHYEPNPARRALASTVRRAPEPLRPGWLMDWAVSDPAYSKAHDAASAFSVLGSAAKPAVPELVRMMNDRAATNSAGLAQYALACIGEETLPFLVAVLEDRNALNRRNAALWIGTLPQLCTNAAPAIPTLVRCLQDRDPQVQWTAAMALGRASLQPDLVVPALVAACQTPAAPVVRLRCISALGDFGPRARSAEACLVAALSDPEKNIRRAATNSLRRVAPEVLTNAAAR